MGWRKALLSVFSLLLCIVTLASATPLDDYVNAPDPTYKWTVNGTHKTDLYTAYYVQLTSQTWMSSNQSNRAVWQHWLTVCVPHELKVSTSFMYIDGGTIRDGIPTSIYPPVELICVQEGAVGAYLEDIPNEPIVFANDNGESRSEDAIIAYTWSHFFNDTSDPTWLARLPMTKAAVRALDTITAVAALEKKNVDTFIVGGASKRGWTTWTTGAVDKRVVAIVPIVMPILNIVPNMNHHYQAYGGWSFALDDYLKMHLMAQLNTPLFEALGAIVDPFTYIDRLTMPKYIICATGDEFFLPDSAQFFLNSLQGEKLLRLIPNAEHSMAGHELDLTTSIMSFFHQVVYNKTFPQISWNTEFLENGNAVISVNATTTPSSIRLFTADTISTTLRDFRLIVCYDVSNPDCIQPVIWLPKDISMVNGVIPSQEVEPPYKGWRGFLIEADFKITETYTFKVSTEVYVLPNVMPFPPCGNNCQPTFNNEDDDDDINAVREKPALFFQN